ncbi:Cytochrome c oxidase biogenesis protein Cmc1-like [Trypanosoma melophagium]|uniref:Cytochrome c oxidase biogenesis protein Cmc1-like n=1 Tax=Trypanosoma melophagium TaxID=715481 RepID=UPI003519ED2B|nr:Cytochrome c oxidase biogenesis protein Cmc1-like [Trypanosoma melophagium]
MSTTNTDAAQKKAQEFLSKDAIEELRSVTDKTGSRVRHGLLPRDHHTVDTEHENKVNAYIAERRTWRKNVYVLRNFEYWRLRAEYYPYIERSDAYSDNFFIRGITCHPRLSDYPTCRAVIQDYFICRDKNKVMQVFNMCAPLKEQFCACINEVFIKNHERGDKKFNARREEYFEEQRGKRFAKLLNQAEESMDQRRKLQD